MQERTPPGTLSYLREIGITQSILKTWRSTCPKKARLILDGWHKNTSSEALAFGELFHLMLEKTFTLMRKNDLPIISAGSYEDILKESKKELEPYLLGSSIKIKQEYEKCLGMVFVIVKHYFTYWNNEYFGSRKKNWLQVENKFKVFPDGLDGVPLVGRRDGVYTGEFGIKAKALVLLETKTKGNWDEDNLTYFLLRDLQTMLYVNSYFMEFGEMPYGVQYNLIRRPALRMKQEESLASFCRRVDENVTEKPESYFVKIEMPLDPKTVAEQWKIILRDARAFIDWYVSGESSEYTENCVTNSFGACSFLIKCSGLIDDRITRRETAYVELSK